MTISLEQCFMDRARLASRPPVGSDLPTLLLKARTRTEVEKGKLLELKAKVEAGKFVDADEVKVAAFNKARIVRDALLNIASRLAPLIAAETDERACFDLIDREVRQALDAWFALDPSEHRAQVGLLLAASLLRVRGKTFAHLPALALGLRQSGYRWRSGLVTVTAAIVAFGA
jgi:hypothetical protein